jgi:LysR family glycine cleavage system transcriptional activator
MKYWEHVPPLKVLLAVEATARLGSFSKAAGELNVTQSAVSHLVAQAEALLSTQLFQRQARPVQLTPEGRRYVDAVVAGLNLIRSEGEQLQRASRSDTLTVSCNLANANFWLLPRLKEFHDGHPEITVNVVTAYQGLPPLHDGIDLSIRFGHGDWPDCAARLLFFEWIVPVASVSYAERMKAVRKPADFLNHTLLHARADDKSWFDWQQWFRHFGVKLRASLPGPVFDNHLMMMQAALAGGGIALGWIGTASEHVRNGQLVELFPEKIGADGGVYLVSRERAPVNKAAALFADWLMSMPRPVF